jgi:integrase
LKRDPIRKFLVREEFQALLTVARSNLRDHALVLTMYECALRAAEPGQLTLDDAQLLHKRKLYVRRGKGSREGYVELSRTTARAISRWVEYCYPRGVSKRTLKSWLYPGPRVLGRRAGITRFGVYKIIQALSAAAGLNVRLGHPHVLKHTRVMDLYEAVRKSGGHPHDAIPLVAKLVGHKEAKTTLEYYLSETEEQKQLIVDATNAAVVLPDEE